MTVPTTEMKVEPEKLLVEPEGEGWSELQVQVSLASSFACDFTMTAEDLFLKDGGESAAFVVSKAFDIRLIPEEGWSGDRLECNKTYRFRYRVNVSPNLLPGTYAGGVLLKVTGKTKSAEVRLPVELIVK
jgi:hypothetical protein